MGFGPLSSDSKTENKSAEFGQQDSPFGAGIVSGSNLKGNSQINLTSITTDPDLIEASADIVNQTLFTAETNLAEIVDLGGDALADSFDFAGDLSGDAFDFAGDALADSFDFASDTAADSFGFAGDSLAENSDLIAAALDFAGDLVAQVIDIAADGSKKVIDTVNTIGARESGNNDARIAELSDTAMKGAMILGLGALALIAFK